MADCFVTGIASTEEVAALETALGGIPELDHSRLSVITKADRSDRHDRSFLNFVHAGGPQLDAAEVVGNPIYANDSILSGSGGTGVPGVSADRNSLGYLGHPYVEQHVGVLPIPEDEADNYNDALDDGRTVVAYRADSGASASIEAAFHTAGLRKVKTFA